MNPNASWIIVVIAIMAVSAVVRSVTRSTLGDALAERIRAGRSRHWRKRRGEWVEEPVSSAEGERVKVLEEQVAQLTSQIAELHERVDFAERLLTKQREHQLGAGQ